MLAIVQHCRRPGAGNKLFAAEPRTPVGDPTGTVLQRPRQRWCGTEHLAALQIVAKRHRPASAHRVVTGRRGSERATGAHHLMIAHPGANAALNADHTHALAGVRTQPAATPRIATPSKPAIGKPRRPRP